MNSFGTATRMLALVAAMSVMLAACSQSGETESTPPGEADGTTTTVEERTTTTMDINTPTTTVAGTTGVTEAEALALVESLFAAYNSGDMATWVLWREGGEGSPADAAYWAAVGSRFEIEQCTYRGYGEWQMDSPMIGHGFDCKVTQTDHLLEAAGIELQMTYNWVVGADPESSLGGSNENVEFVDRFMSEYRDWLAANHPNAEATIRYGTDSDYPDPDSVPTALEYIDEFVAQSDIYPLTEPVPPGDYGGPLS